MDISEELKHDIQEGEEKVESFLFYLSVWWRVFYGFISLFLGTALLWFVGVTVGSVVAFLSQVELGKGFHSTVSPTLNHWLGGSGTQVTLFTAAYFIFWGVLDIFLYISILLKKLWAYSVAMYLIACFTVYMLYRYTQTGSKVLLVLVAVDVIIVFLTYRERQRAQHHHIADILNIK